MQSGMYGRDICRQRWQIAIVYVVFLSVIQAHSDCFVRTNLGPVKGSMKNSWNGKPFCSYRGIPYAEPPIGDLRFKAPRGPRPWSKTLDALTDSPLCIQNDLVVPVGSEDCLYLNVYTPEQSSDSKSKHPVIVYIHGGKFSVGSGVSFISGPWYLMDRAIVLVTINYRLGVMGFLSTGDDEAPGNYGMKDQVAALRWVQQNIQEFGGDSERVTVQGQSAGSKSIHFHMFSALSRGSYERIEVPEDQDVA
ncbi:Esterase FE4 [Zootermopsis nevadensis]|uniref:Carboxylic ester hydrolase n=1 Tax=Zootermopsis nevadensis TaxID=136037 RepID=A0A067RAC1_ZOONE|nr:Esterase FE4 [Zootermopsis nevadensis]